MPDLFEELLAGGEAAVQQLVADRRLEDIDIEFKTKANAANGEVEPEDRENFGIALSAFSNSMGGTLVWGVKAAKNSDGIDCAIALRPIFQLTKFQSQITELVSRALMPRHEGIRIESIPASNPVGSGYLVIRIDRSERRPHRCEFKGLKQYYKRIGDSSIAMEHYDIEDSFKRLVVPTLEAERSLAKTSTRSGPEGNFVGIKISITLRNTSSVSARFPYLIIKGTKHIQARPSFRRGFQFPSGVFEGGADEVIHPEMTMRALDLEREFKLNQNGELPRGTLPSPILIQYQCGSLHSRPSFGTFENTIDDVAAALGLQVEPISSE
jgi:Putative DNA-binding domain